MDLLRLIALGLLISGLLFFAWYMAERCFVLYDSRKARAQRRVRFQRVWRSRVWYGDELDYIISRKEDSI